MEILELIESYLGTSGLKSLTRKRYGYMIKKFLNYHPNKKPGDIALEDARDFLNYLREDKNLTIGTVNDYRSSIKYLFEVVLDKGWNDRKIAYLRGYKPLPTVLEKSEIKKILETIEDITCRAIFTTIYSSGLRIQEAINLKISDIDKTRMQINIRESKNGYSRYAILSQRNLTVLREYLIEHPLKKLGKWDPEDYMFCISKRTSPVCSRTVRKSLNNAVEKLKVSKKITVHSLRHSFAVHLLEQGTDIFTIKTLLGHRSITSTCVYLQVVDMRIFGGKSPLDS